MKFVGNVLAKVFSIIFFIVLFLMMILFFLSNVFSANYYKNILNDIDLSEIKLADLGITGEEFSEDASVEDLLVDSLKEAGISENDAKKIVNNEKINEVVGNFISDTMNYLTYNEEVPQLDYKDVKEIIESNEVSSVLEDTPNDKEIKEFVDEVNKYLVESFEGGM